MSILGAALWTADGEPVRPPGAVDRPTNAHPAAGTRFPRPAAAGSVPVGESELWADNARLRRERDAALARVAELTRTVDLLGRVIVHAAGHDKGGA